MYINVQQHVYKNLCGPQFAELISCISYSASRKEALPGSDLTDVKQVQPFSKLKQQVKQAVADLQIYTQRRERKHKKGKKATEHSELRESEGEGQRQKHEDKTETET